MKRLVFAAALALLALPAQAQPFSNNPLIPSVGGDCSGTISNLTCTKQYNIAGASVLRGYMAGCITSNDGTSPNTVIDVGACAAVDDTNIQPMTVGAFTKNMNAAFAVGSTNGCLDGHGAVTTLQASTSYFIYEIWGSGQTVDYLCSSQAFGTVDFPTNYTLKRAIGWVATDGSSHIKSFVQDEETWYLTDSGAPYKDINVTNLATGARTLETLTVPLGIKVRPVGPCITTGSNFWITAPDMPDYSPAATFSTSPGFNAGTQITKYNDAYTNTSGQVGVRSQTGTNTLICYTTGFQWTRGRLN